MIKAVRQPCAYPPLAYVILQVINIAFSNPSITAGTTQMSWCQDNSTLLFCCSFTKTRAAWELEAWSLMVGPMTTYIFGSRATKLITE
jgi:hypothetical protein